MSKNTWVVDSAWIHLADEDDKKELAKRERKKNAEKCKIAAVAKKEERATKKRKRAAVRAEQEEEKKLRKLYKIHAGKRFRRKKGSVSALEQLRNTPVVLGLFGFVKLSNVENVIDKQQKLIQKHNNSVTPEVAAPPPLVDVTKLSPEMAKYAEFMVPDPEIVAQAVKTNKFTPTVSEMEFYQYQTWQRWGRGPKPSWFMTDDAKASDIMSHYKEVEKYYA